MVRRLLGLSAAGGHTANILKNPWTALLRYCFINLDSNSIKGYVGFQDFKQAYVYLCISAVLTAQAQHHTVLLCHFLTLLP